MVSFHSCTPLYLILHEWNLGRHGTIHRSTNFIGVFKPHGPGALGVVFIGWTQNNHCKKWMVILTYHLVASVSYLYMCSASLSKWKSYKLLYIPNCKQHFFGITVIAKEDILLMVTISGSPTGSSSFQTTTSLEYQIEGVLPWYTIRESYWQLYIPNCKQHFWNISEFRGGILAMSCTD